MVGAWRDSDRSQMIEETDVLAVTELRRSSISIRTRPSTSFVPTMRNSVAGNVIKHMQAGERAEAEALLDGEYKQALRKVVYELTELNQHINE